MVAGASEAHPRCVEHRAGQKPTPVRVADYPIQLAATPSGVVDQFFGPHRSVGGGHPRLSSLTPAGSFPHRILT